MTVANRASWCFFSLTILATLALAQAPPQHSMHYLLDYRPPANTGVHVTIALPSPRPAPVALVMPRSYPGGYQQIRYDSFVTNVHAVSPDRAALPVEHDPDGPRWRIGRPGDSVAAIDYEIDVARMEQDLLSAVDSSKIRPAYAGLLGYSIFAFLDGLESHPISLEIHAPAQWPILSTLDPQLPLATGHLVVSVLNYDHLADSQILMGPDLHVSRFDGVVPLFMAAHAEGEADLDAESHLARQALDRVSAYFTGAPLAHYTVQLELLKPLPGHEYDFSQEHFDSGTFVRPIDRALTAKASQQQKDSLLFGLAHHMAHSWIPKRGYGAGYNPFNWEITPVMDTIWFNEGFAQYAALEALAAPLSVDDARALRESRMNRWREILRDAPPVIQRMPLLELSREASFLYSDDFRLGKNTFARGALMAAEMDTSICTTTHNAKGLRDALAFLIARTDRTHQAFRIDELPEIFSEATGADRNELRAILTRWLSAPSD